MVEESENHENGDNISFARISKHGKREWEHLNSGNVVLQASKEIVKESENHVNSDNIFEEMATERDNHMINDTICFAPISKHGKREWESHK